jgi:hypothetical protein
MAPRDWAAVGWVSDHPVADACGAVLLTGAYWHWLGGPNHSVLATLSQDERFVAYQTAAGVTVALFGLVFTAIAILTALTPGRRLRAIQVGAGRRVTATFLSVLRALGFAALVYVADIGLDQPRGHPAVARAAAYLAFALASFRVVRLMWIFGVVLRLRDADVEAEVRLPSKSTEVRRREQVI